MRSYCLNVEETAQILIWREDSASFAGKELSQEIEEAQCWTTLIVCITLFFARVLERGDITIEEQKRKMERLYAMEDELCFEIQEGDDQFIEYLLRHLRNPGDKLDSALIELQNGLSDFSYEKALRY